MVTSVKTPQVPMELLERGEKGAGPQGRGLIQQRPVAFEELVRIREKRDAGSLGIQMTQIAQAMVAVRSAVQPDQGDQDRSAGTTGRRLDRLGHILCGSRWHRDAVRIGPHAAALDDR